MYKWLLHVKHSRYSGHVDHNVVIINSSTGIKQRRFHVKLSRVYKYQLKYVEAVLIRARGGEYDTAA